MHDNKETKKPSIKKHTDIGKFKINKLKIISKIASPKNFDGLTFEASIRANGIRVPIVVDGNGLLLNGRSRVIAYEAACEADPEFRHRFPKIISEVRKFNNPVAIIAFLKQFGSWERDTGDGQTLAQVLIAIEELRDPDCDFQKKLITACCLAFWTDSRHHIADRVIRVFHANRRALELVANGLLSLEEAVRGIRKSTTFPCKDFVHDFHNNWQQGTCNFHSKPLFEVTRHGEIQSLLPFPDSTTTR